MHGTRAKEACTISAEDEVHAATVLGEPILVDGETHHFWTMQETLCPSHPRRMTYRRIQEASGKSPRAFGQWLRHQHPHLLGRARLRGSQNLRERTRQELQHCSHIWGGWVFWRLPQHDRKMVKKAPRSVHWGTGVLQPRVAVRSPARGIGGCVHGWQCTERDDGHGKSVLPETSDNDRRHTFNDVEFRRASIRQGHKRGKKRDRRDSQERREGWMMLSRKDCVRITSKVQDCIQQAGECTVSHVKRKSARLIERRLECGGRDLVAAMREAAKGAKPAPVAGGLRGRRDCR